METSATLAAVLAVILGTGALVASVFGAPRSVELTDEDRADHRENAEC